jgi:hypothetical protein
MDRCIVSDNCQSSSPFITISLVNTRQSQSVLLGGHLLQLGRLRGRRLGLCSLCSLRRRSRSSSSSGGGRSWPLALLLGERRGLGLAFSLAFALGLLIRLDLRTEQPTDTLDLGAS